MQLSSSALIGRDIWTPAEKQPDSATSKQRGCVPLSVVHPRKQNDVGKIKIAALRRCDTFLSLDVYQINTND